MDADFPNLGNVDVYAYENTFDYSRFKPNARLKMCNVPWCGDYENVVKFENDTARDEWFDALSGDVVNLETMFNVKPDGSAKVPVPVTSAQIYNYLVVDLPRMTSDAQPIEYASGKRKARYFYFILDARQLSPGSTRLVLELDMWTTYINDMQFDYILLERGHAPVAASPVADYLENPRDNSAYLLTADVNTGGEPYIERSRAVKNYSAEGQRACIVTACDLQGGFGTASAPTVPALSEPDTSGILASRVYSVAVEDLQKFLRAMEQNAPWIKQTVHGVFFAPGDLLTQSDSFTLWGAPVTVCDAVQKVEPFLQPGISDFDYPAQAAPFAKLYTYPYAAIRVSDERGQSSIVRVEDLGAQGIEVASAINLIMPYISIDARLLGIAGASDSLTFQTMEGRIYNFGGAWGDYLKSWDIPIMQVTQSAATRADYTTVYERAHAKLAADNALASSLASNATAEGNANRSNATAEGNTGRASAASVANTADRVANANKINDNNAALSNNVTGRMNSSINSNVSIDNAMSTAMTDVKNDIAALAGISNAGSTLASAGIAATASGPLALATGVTGVVSSAVSTVISQSSNEAFTTLAVNANTLKGAEQKLVNSYTNAQQLTTNAANLASSNATDTAIAQRNANTSNANASASRSTGDANAAASRSTSDANANRTHATAIDAIQARLSQAGVAAPARFGAGAGGRMDATAPRALFAQIVTQRECDIMNAASTFARYGYALMREWSMERMQVMRHFTYWKCAEVWCSGTGAASEGAQAAVKDILIKGVTVWSKPEDIGRVSIYDNI